MTERTDHGAVATHGPYSVWHVRREQVAVASKVQSIRIPDFFNGSLM